MGCSNVKILVKTLDFDEAIEKALEIFSNEGKLLSDDFSLDVDIEEKSCVLAGYEAIKNAEFLNIYEKQFKEYQDKIVSLVFNNYGRFDFKDLPDCRNKFSQLFGDYLVSHITFKVSIYDGESFCPFLNIEKLRLNPNDYFIVSINYKY